MIGWLKGKRIDNWQNGVREGIVIDCSGVGYEVQLIPRELSEINLHKETILWIHQIHRDEAIILFGFMNQKERNLFRSLIGVNGIGPQIGIALLEEFNSDELIAAIINCEIDKLCKANGIGKRIAERLTMELKNKLLDAIKANLFKDQRISTAH